MFSPHRQARTVDASDPPAERIGSSSPTPHEFRWRSGPLAPVSLMTILDELRPWLDARVHTGLALVPGTAEAWAAADLAGWLNQSAGGRPERIWDIELEAAIYDDRALSVALLFNRHSATPTCPMIAMGIRVQSHLVSTARFLQGVEAEMGRLERQPRRAEFQDVERHLLVITMDAAGMSTVLPHGLDMRAILPAGPAVLWKGFRRGSGERNE